MWGTRKKKVASLHEKIFRLCLYHKMCYVYARVCVPDRGLFGDAEGTLSKPCGDYSLVSS